MGEEMIRLLLKYRFSSFISFSAHLRVLSSYPSLIQNCHENAPSHGTLQKKEASSSTMQPADPFAPSPYTGSLRVAYSASSCDSIHRAEASLKHTTKLSTAVIDKDRTAAAGIISKKKHDINEKDKLQRLDFLLQCTRYSSCDPKHLLWRRSIS